MPKVTSNASLVNAARHTAAASTPKRGKTTCDFSGCFKSYSNPTDLSRHKWSHLPRCLLPRCPFENCDFVYTGRNGALETHWNENHSHLTATGQPFPDASYREAAVSSRKPVKKSCTKLCWPSLDEILAYHKVALGEHPANPPTDHTPIPYPPGVIHIMRHTSGLGDCSHYPIAQATSVPLQSSSPVASVASTSVGTPSTSYSQQLYNLGPNPQYQSVGPLPVFDQCIPSLPEYAPPSLPFMGNLSMGPLLPFNSSPFSTLDGPWDFPVWNDPVQQDILGGDFDFSMMPAPPMPLGNPFELEGVWDYFPDPSCGSYL